MLIEKFKKFGAGGYTQHKMEFILPPPLSGLIGLTLVSKEYKVMKRKFAAFSKMMRG